MKNTTFKRNTLIGVMAVVLSLVMVFTMAVNDPSHAASPTPGKVTLTKISSSAYNKVTVSWKKVSNATNYKIYYKKSGASRWTGLKTVGSGTTSYTHTASSSKPITVGQKYVYTVKGYNSKSKKTGSYNTKGLAVATRPNTVKLGSVSLNSAKTQTTLTWSKAGGANQYLVYRKTPGNSWKKLATVGSSTVKYTDKAPVKGQTNTYTVKSYYSKTKTAGKYNSKGISIAVPKAVVPTPTPTEKPNKPVLIDSIEITPMNPVLKLGDTMKLTAKIYPSNATNKSVIWENYSPDIIKLTENGNTATITGLKYGTAEVVITAADSGKPMDFTSIEVAGGSNGELDPDEAAREVGELTNEVRARHNRSPLIYSQTLQNAAMIRAKELAIKYSHIRPDETIPLGAGNITGENIANGYRTPDSVVDAWEKSPGHLLGMCQKYDTHMGAGYYKAPDGKTYWVQLFGGNPDKKCTITFDPTGGRFDTLGGITKYEVITPSGQAVYMKDIPVPVKDGYTFDGWVDKYGLKLNYNAMTCTMYATWIKK